jgi:hypothetical protein
MGLHDFFGGESVLEIDEGNDEINKQFEDAGLPELKDNRNAGVLSERLQDGEIKEATCAF